MRINSGEIRFFVSLPIGGRGAIGVRLPGRSLAPLEVRPEGSPRWRRPTRGPFISKSRSWTGDSRPPSTGALFDPIDFDDLQGVPAIRMKARWRSGFRSGRVVVADLRLYRDVHYTSSLANTPRRPFGVDSPYLLGTDEFFVLGDNSPVSNDSRFWSGSPVVPGELFLGKPFLVHLPGQVVPLKVFGRSVYWVPDPREIRYIR